MEKKKETLLLYNINDREKQHIEKIFKDLDIKIELQEITEEEDILAYPSFITFIKMSKDNEKIGLVNEIVDVIRGWTIIFFVDEKFFDDIEQIKKKIEEYYDENENLKVMYDYNSNFIKDGIIGFTVGDAFGVPAEFKSREELKKHPITNMIESKTYNVPAGTWSDDTSMTLATMDSIIQTKKIDTKDMARRFVKWFRNGEYTATGKTFDIGRTTLQSLAKFEMEIDDAENCGQNTKMDNGNGSLMRMLPIAYYIWIMEYEENTQIDDITIYNIVKRTSSITHRHEISIMGCYIFVKYALEIMDGKYKDIAYENIQKMDYSFFDNETIREYSRILKDNIKEQNIDKIKSTGYIVDTLEAVLWLFLNSKDYNSTIIKAVSLGNDTDTISAITGGLLGIHYGHEKINNEWIKTIKNIDYIEKMCEDLYATKLEKL